MEAISGNQMTAQIRTQALSGRAVSAEDVRVCDACAKQAIASFSHEKHGANIDRYMAQVLYLALGSRMQHGYPWSPRALVPGKRLEHMEIPQFSSKGQRKLVKRCCR